MGDSNKGETGGGGWLTGGTVTKGDKANAMNCAGCDPKQ